MAIEIERKFLVQGDAWRALGSALAYRQGYLLSSLGKTVRVRQAGDRGYLTIKGETQGISRQEFEYEIPLPDVEELLEMCDRPLIEKTRHKILHNGLSWEVDEFWGDNEGLIIAEVELTDPDQLLDLPDWVDREVSHDPRYFNAALARQPYRSWPGNR